MVSVSIIPMINAIIVRREKSMSPLPCDVFTIGVFARGGKGGIKLYQSNDLLITINVMLLLFSEMKLKVYNYIKPITRTFILFQAIFKTYPPTLTNQTFLNNAEDRAMTQLSLNSF